MRFFFKLNKRKRKINGTKKKENIYETFLKKIMKRTAEGNRCIVECKSMNNLGTVLLLVKNIFED